MTTVHDDLDERKPEGHPPSGFDGKLVTAFRMDPDKLTVYLVKLRVRIEAVRRLGPANNAGLAILEHNIPIHGAFYVGFVPEVHEQYVQETGLMIRERGNPHDSNAIRVYAVPKTPGEEYRAVGYVAAKWAEKLSDHMDSWHVLAIPVRFSAEYTLAKMEL